MAIFFVLFSAYCFLAALLIVCIVLRTQHQQRLERSIRELEARLFVQSMDLAQLNARCNELADNHQRLFKWGCELTDWVNRQALGDLDDAWKRGMRPDGSSVDDD